MVLMTDGTFFNFDESQAGMIISMIEGAVGAIAAGFVLYQLKIGDAIEEQHSGIDEARFILQFNQSFIQDSNMSDIEHRLELCGIYGKLPYEELITEENRQSLINYLVYLESLAPFISQGIIKLEHVDDLMAYRFFIAVNNKAVQKDQLFEFPEYYRGCFKLYAMWRDYRIENDRKILMSDTALDRWHRKSYEDVLVNYFNCISKDLDEDESVANVVCVCVDKAYRGWGIGKKLLNNYISQHPDKTIVLDVLANNDSAIRLYKKCGFVISGEPTAGYAFDKEPPLCYKMVRQAAEMNNDSVK